MLVIGKDSVLKYCAAAHAMSKGRRWFQCQQEYQRHPCEERGEDCIIPRMQRKWAD